MLEVAAGNVSFSPIVGFAHRMALFSLSRIWCPGMAFLGHRWCLLGYKAPFTVVGRLKEGENMLRVMAKLVEW